MEDSPMFRTVRFALLAAPLMLAACANKNPKTEPRAEEYSYTPTSTGRSPDTTTGTTSTTYNPSTTDTGSTYTASTYTPPSNPAPTATPYTPPPAAPAGDTYGSTSSTMRVADEPLSPAKSRSRSNGSTAGGKTYTVKKGDTLGGIAQKHYGSASKWERIYNANKTKVSDPKKLRVGTKLIIP
jgi:nucleoid-associated protein YgaU